MRKRLAFQPQVEALEPRRTPAVSFDVQQDVASGNVHSVAVADFNGDGKPDVAFADWGAKFFVNPSVGVLLNTTPAGMADASFAAAQTFAVGTGPGAPSTYIAVGDFNGDGKPDLAVGIENTVAILLNTTPTGSGTVSFAAPQTFAVGTSANFVAVRDFNGDGKPDIAVANQGSNTVSVLLNTTATGSGTASFTAQQTFAVGTSPSALTVADCNGDSKPDLAVANSGSNTVSVLLNTTATGSLTASFTAQQTFAVGTNPTSVAAADFNGDGKPDLAVGNPGSNTVSVLLNTTTTGSLTASFAAQQTLAANSYANSVVAADLNGDGKPDMASGGGTGVSVLVNTTPAMASTVSFVQQTSATGGYDALAAGDFNGDGKADLVGGNGNEIFSGKVTVLLNTSFSAVIGQFGGDGIREYNNDTGAWTQLTAANASRLAADSFGDVVATFPGQGVWEFLRTSGWKRINGIDANVLAMNAQGDIVANFPGVGVGQWVPSANGWRLLTGAIASLLATDPLGAVAGEFPGHGVWEFLPASGWKQINGIDATALAIDAVGEIAANFPGYGVGEYTLAPGWVLLNGNQASTLAMDARGDVAAQFVGFGVGRYVPGSGWGLLTAANAVLLAADDGDVFGAFGGAGVWQFDLVRRWIQLTAAAATALAAA